VISDSLIEEEWKVKYLLSNKCVGLHRLFLSLFYVLFIILFIIFFLIFFSDFFTKSQQESILVQYNLLTIKL